MEIILGMIIILFAAFIQGLTSFGLSMIAVPFLIKIFPLKEIVPIIVFLALLTNIPIIISSRKVIRFRNFGVLIIMGILFIPAGVYSLKYFSSDYLKLFFGILITGFSLLLIFKKTFPVKHEKIGYALAGSLSGFLNGSLSLSGPPVVLFLSNQGINKNTFRANIAAYFLLLNIITIILFLANGLLNEVVFGKIIYLALPLYIGVFAGIKAFKKMKEEVFRKIVLIILFASGLWTTISTFISMIKI